MRIAECRMRNDQSKTRPCRVAMLHVMLLLLFVFSTSGASCTRSIRSPFAPYSPPAPEVLAVGSSLDQVISAVNQNAARIQSYQTNNASLTVPGMPGIPLLGGKIAAQRPGRVHLQASTSLTGAEVDLGANDELFWFWVKRNEPPALYFARHDQFCGSAAQKLLPIEPQWLLDALGFVEFRPGDHHEGPLPLGGGKVEIKSTMQGRCGLMTKRTIIDARRAWVLEQHVYDGSGTLIASAVAKSHRYYPQAGVSLPQELEIRIPASNLALSIDVGTVEINSIKDNPQLWAMPVINGAPPTDLGSSAQSAGGVQRFGDQLTRADWNGAGPPTGSPPVLMPEPLQVATTTGAASNAPAPQFITPGGVVAPIQASPSIAPPGVQRLPSGGIATQPAFVR
jgi:hypothetical protein